MYERTSVHSVYQALNNIMHACIILLRSHGKNNYACMYVYTHACICVMYHPYPLYIAIGDNGQAVSTSASSSCQLNNYHFASTRKANHFNSKRYHSYGRRKRIFPQVELTDKHCKMLL